LHEQKPRDKSKASTVHYGLGKGWNRALT
jgi:hypothetical protein